jgi:exodeoxyribonuclease VII large subunit
MPTAEPDALFPRPVYRVSELLAEVSGALSSGWRQISVAGEACEVRRYPSGHVYFALKDETGKLSAVMWRSDAARLPFAIEEGLEIVVTGTLALYAARGQFQIQVSAARPIGAGALALAFEQLKKKLAAEGLFDEARKRPLPFLPRHIGIVTSPQGAAIRDILNILRRRHPDLGITIYPARVQGDTAAEEIAEGIRALNRMARFDVLIVSRGGGSAEDLAAFNDERVARALADSVIPTISAVGHETDWTICDFVADLRAPTPSAAAELVVGVKDEISARVSNCRRALAQLARRRLAEIRARVEAAARAESLVRFRYQLMRRRDRFEAALEALGEAAQTRPVRWRERVDRLKARLGSLEQLRLSRVSGRFAEAAAKLSALSPLEVLKRGYAAVFRPGDSRVVSAASRLSAGEEIRVRLHRGSFSARVVDIFGEEE